MTPARDSRGIAEHGGGTSAPVLSPFWQDVAHAMAEGMESPKGERIGAICWDRHDGTYKVEYLIGETPVGTCTYRADSDARRISELAFALHKYERRHRGYDNVKAIHERLLENLRGSGCVLSTKVESDDSAFWAGYYDWDPEHGDLNAASFAAAVEQIYAAAKNQQVWDASDLPQRVQLIGGPLLEPVALRAPWHHLLTRRSPRELLAGLNEFQPNLGQVVFGHMSGWYGRRVVD